MKKTLLLSITMLVIALMGCSSKSSDSDEDALSDVLTASTWNSVTNLEDIDLDGTFVEFGDDCEKDDEWKFKSDGNYTQQDTGEPCDGTGGFTADGTWFLENNDQTLVLRLWVDDIKFKVLSYSNTELELGLIESDNPTGIFTQKLILKR